MNANRDESVPGEVAAEAEEGEEDDDPDEDLPPLVHQEVQSLVPTLSSRVAPSV